MVTVPLNNVTQSGFRLNTPPPEFRAERDLPTGFLEFFAPLHERFAPWQEALVAERRRVLEEAHQGNKPCHRFPAEAVRNGWRIELPEWCQDQRNQMVGPADDAASAVRMLNSGAPGVVLDLEDSIANEWPNQRQGVENILDALHGRLNYNDPQQSHAIGMEPRSPVIWVRPRGLHLNQAGIFGDQLTPASLFDVASIAFGVEAAQLKHPLAFYIPKSESAEEAVWWRDLFRAVSAARGWSRDYIKCMALVESYPLAFQMEEFLYNLREHVLGLALGRSNYMASLVHFHLEDPCWVLPDRGFKSRHMPCYQNLRELMPEICHKRGVLAIGAMTSAFPSREDPDLHARAMAVVEEDKKNEADCLMDGAWTGHPDQNQVAVAQFPAPNQLHARRAHGERYPDLRPVPQELLPPTLNGTRAAVRTVIRYRNAVLNSKGCSLQEGCREDLGSDRMCRLMIAQRMRHSGQTDIVDDSGEPVEHSPELISELFDEQVEMLALNRTREDPGTSKTLREARRIAEDMVLNEEFDVI